MEQKGPAFKGFKVAVPSLKFNAAFYPVDMRGVGMHELPDLPGILEIQLLKASDLEAVNLDGSKILC